MPDIQAYRLVLIGETNVDAVTVGIELDAEGGIKAAIWWEARGDVDADEAEFSTVPEALAAAKAARALHGFAEVVVVLAQPDLWDGKWGLLKPGPGAEPIGDVRGTDLSSDEAYQLATGIEAERDA